MITHRIDCASLQRSAQCTCGASSPTSRRWLERLVIYGGGLVVVVVLCQFGMHPAVAVLLGIVTTLLIAGALSLSGTA